MKITRKGSVIGGIVAVAAVAATVTACGPTQLNDLRNTPTQYPDYASIVLNVDNYPNVTVLCIRGVGFATTTRDYSAIMRVPEWDKFCVTREGMHTTTNGSAGAN